MANGIVNSTQIGSILNAFQSTIEKVADISNTIDEKGMNTGKVVDNMGKAAKNSAAAMKVMIGGLMEVSDTVSSGFSIGKAKQMITNIGNPGTMLDILRQKDATTLYNDSLQGANLIKTYSLLYKTLIDISNMSNQLNEKKIKKSGKKLAASVSSLINPLNKVSNKLLRLNTSGEFDKSLQSFSSILSFVNEVYKQLGSISKGGEGRDVTKENNNVFKFISSSLQQIIALGEWVEGGSLKDKITDGLRSMIYLPKKSTIRKKRIKASMKTITGLTTGLKSIINNMAEVFTALSSIQGNAKNSKTGMVAMCNIFTALISWINGLTEVKKSGKKFSVFNKFSLPVPMIMIGGIDLKKIIPAILSLQLVTSLLIVFAGLASILTNTLGKVGKSALMTKLGMMVLTKLFRLRGDEYIGQVMEGKKDGTLSILEIVIHLNKNKGLFSKIVKAAKVMGMFSLMLVAAIPMILTLKLIGNSWIKVRLGLWTFRKIIGGMISIITEDVTREQTGSETKITKYSLQYIPASAISNSRANIFSMSVMLLYSLPMLFVLKIYGSNFIKIRLGLWTFRSVVGGLIGVVIGDGKNTKNTLVNIEKKSIEKAEKNAKLLSNIVTSMFFPIIKLGILSVFILPAIITLTGISVVVVGFVGLMMILNVVGEKTMEKVINGFVNGVKKLVDGLATIDGKKIKKAKDSIKVLLMLSLSISLFITSLVVTSMLVTPQVLVGTLLIVGCIIIVASLIYLINFVFSKVKISVITLIKFFATLVIVSTMMTVVAGLLAAASKAGSMIEIGGLFNLAFAIFSVVILSVMLIPYVLVSGLVIGAISLMTFVVTQILIISGLLLIFQIMPLDFKLIKDRMKDLTQIIMFYIVEFFEGIWLHDLVFAHLKTKFLILITIDLIILSGLFKLIQIIDLDYKIIDNNLRTIVISIRNYIEGIFSKNPILEIVKIVFAIMYTGLTIVLTTELLILNTEMYGMQKMVLDSGVIKNNINTIIETLQHYTERIGSLGPVQTMFALIATPILIAISTQLLTMATMFDKINKMNIDGEGVRRSVEGIVGSLADSISYIGNINIPDLFFIEFKLKRMYKVSKYVSYMAESMANIASLKYATKWNKLGWATEYESMKPEDFEMASLNAGKILTFWATLLDPKTGVITDSLMDSLTFSTRWKFRRLRSIVENVTDMAISVADVASLKYATKWDKNGRPIDFKQMTETEFEKAATNTGLVLQCIVKAITNPEMDEFLKTEYEHGKDNIEMICMLGTSIGSMMEGVEKIASGSFPIEYDPKTGKVLRYGKIDTIIQNKDKITQNIRDVLGVYIKAVLGNEDIQKQGEGGIFDRILGNDSISKARRVVDNIKDLHPTLMDVLKGVKDFSSDEINEDLIKKAGANIGGTIDLYIKQMQKFAEMNVDFKKLENGLDGFTGFVKNTNNIKIENVKTLTEMFKQMTEFSQSISGDFDKLAEILNDKLLTVLTELKDVLSGKPLDNTDYISKNVDTEGNPISGNPITSPSAPLAPLDEKLNQPTDELKNSIDKLIEAVESIKNSAFTVKPDIGARFHTVQDFGTGGSW